MPVLRSSDDFFSWAVTGFQEALKNEPRFGLEVNCFGAEGRSWLCTLTLGTGMKLFLGQ